jgi:hypothetical protein
MANRLQILVGIAALLFGTLVYLIDRPPEQTYFVYLSPINLSLYKKLPNFFGTIGNSLPTFIHVFAFILITAGLTSCKKGGYIAICLGWFLVDIAFEVGQKFSSRSAEIIPDWFEGIPFLENTKNYFTHGTFDFYDIISIALGALAAYIVLLKTMGRTDE